MAAKTKFMHIYGEIDGDKKTYRIFELTLEKGLIEAVLKLTKPAKYEYVRRIHGIADISLEKGEVLQSLAFDVHPDEIRLFQEGKPFFVWALNSAFGVGYTAEEAKETFLKGKAEA
jgi:hypothetical protein